MRGCISVVTPVQVFILFEAYLVAAVDRGVLSDTVDLVAGAVVDNVVR